jgi:hypothetical protein
MTSQHVHHAAAYGASFRQLARRRLPSHNLRMPPISFAWPCATDIEG